MNNNLTPLDSAQVLLPAWKLAERWDTSTQRLANLRCAGHGPGYYKIGQRVLYPLAEIVTYEEANFVTTCNAA